MSDSSSSAVSADKSDAAVTTPSFVEFKEGSQVWQFGMPECACVGQYSGGIDIRLVENPPLVLELIGESQRRLLASLHRDDSFWKRRVLRSLNDELRGHYSLPADERTVVSDRLPLAAVSWEDFVKWPVCFHFSISHLPTESAVASDPRAGGRQAVVDLNLMTHGSLFAEQLTADPFLQASQRYPLIGVFGAVNVSKPPATDTQMDTAHISEAPLKTDDLTADGSSDIDMHAFADDTVAVSTAVHKTESSKSGIISGVHDSDSMATSFVVDGDTSIEGFVDIVSAEIKSETIVGTDSEGTGTSTVPVAVVREESGPKAEGCDAWDEAQRYAGVDALRFADAHFHLEMDGSFHIGSNMAKVRVLDASEPSLMAVVTVDSEKRCCHVTLLLVLSSLQTAEYISQTVRQSELAAVKREDSVQRLDLLLKSGVFAFFETPQPLIQEVIYDFVIRNNIHFP